MKSGGAESGQTTVELALALPFLVLLLTVLVGIGMVAADQVRLIHAAREGARVGSVDPDAGSVREAIEATGLHGVAVEISPQESMRVQGRPLSVSLTYSPGTDTPILGKLLRGLRLHASATMRIETP